MGSAARVPVPVHCQHGRLVAAELGRQPWLIYGLFRTSQGASPAVHSGDALFSLVGFCGLYLVLGLLFLFLVRLEIVHGPEGRATSKRKATSRR